MNTTPKQKTAVAIGTLRIEASVRFHSHSPLAKSNPLGCSPSSIGHRPSAISLTLPNINPLGCSPSPIAHRPSSIGLTLPGTLSKLASNQEPRTRNQEP